MDSTAKLTKKYISEHPHIKNCLKKGIINYSSLARTIAKDLGIVNKTSMEAILVAARRYKKELSDSRDTEIKKLMSSSEIELKNRIIVMITGKNIDLDSFEKLGKKIHRMHDVFYLLEGSNNYTIITQKKYLDFLPKKYIKLNKDLVLVTIKSGNDIETTPGVIAYLTSLFAENGVNIYEFLSCWTDTLFVINKKDLNKAIEFLEI